MKRFNHLIIVVWCLSLITLFYSTFSAQETVKDTTEFPRVVFAFDRAMLLEAEIKDIQAANDLWMKKIGEKTGYIIESYIYNNLDSLLRDYRKGFVDIMSFAPVNYLRLEKKLLNVEPCFATVVGGKKTRKLLLIVRSDSAYSGIQEFRGRKIAIMKNYEMDYIYLNTLLLRKKLGKAEKFFSAIIEKTKYSQAILSVFFGQTDACIATDLVLQTMIELNPQVGSKLKIIASSPEMIHMVAYRRASMDKRIKDDGLREILNLNNTTLGRQGLVLFGADRFIPLFESNLDTVRELIIEYNELLKKNKF